MPKQLPFEDAELAVLWDAQRRYHGGEPCKVGHIEFARSVQTVTLEPIRKLLQEYKQSTHISKADALAQIEAMVGEAQP